MTSLIPTFSSYITPDDTIILAVSGGVDSMVLLNMVLHSHNRANIIVAHLDHSLRGVESDGDRELVASICKRENIVFEVEKFDIAHIAKTEKSSLEAIARRERYSFLESVREQYGARYILTAHHAVDQTETVIGNMIKGAKVRGLSGMSMVSGFIFRPLLNIPKSDILEYASEHQVSYREDSTNSDATYDRNRIRHDIIPVLESLNPNIHNTLGELTIYMQGLGKYFSTQVESWLIQSERESGKPNTFLISSFGLLDVFFRREIISYLYSRSHAGSSQGLSRGLIDELIRFIGDPGSYGVKEVKKLKLERRGERIFICSTK